MNLLQMSTGVFLSTLALAAGLVALTIKICARRGWVAVPRPDRWHQGKPSLFGGVPIWITFVGLAPVFVPAADRSAWAMIAASTGMFLLGLADDLWHLSPRLKLLLQFLSAVWMMLALEIHIFPNPIANWVIALLWIVGLTNAFNLLDNMDGLAAGIGLIAALGLGILYAHTGAGYPLLLVLIGGAASGFLIFNFYPARIFMGDSGSLFLGFLLATISLRGASQGAKTSALIFAPVLIMAVPIMDTFFVSLTRRLRGQPISLGGTDHCSHRLVRLGLDERQAVLLLYGLAAVSSGVALAGQQLHMPNALVLDVGWASYLLLVSVYIFRPSTLVNTTHAARSRSWLGRLVTQVRKSFPISRYAIDARTMHLVSSKRVFVLGTSDSTADVLHFLRDRHIQCAGLIDTNGGSDVGRWVWGTRVVAGVHDLSGLGDNHDVAEVFSAENEPMSCSPAELQDFCQRAHLKLVKLSLYATHPNN